jgi:hypothetical protein
MKNGAPDTVQCARPASKRNSHSRVSAGRTPLKFTGLSGVPLDCPVIQRSNGSLRTNGRLQNATVLNNAASEVRSHRTVQCGTELSGAARRQDKLTWRALESEQ